MPKTQGINGMNMIAQPEQFEQQPASFEASSASSDDTAEADLTPREAEQTSLLERFAWFRNKPLSGKIHTVFGTFFGVGLAIALILGLGLSELWNRYRDSAEVNSALVASAQLTGTAGELRYNTARFLFEREPKVLARQGESFAAAMAHVDAVETVVKRQLPDMADEAAQLRADLDAYNTTFKQAIAVAQSEGRSPRSEALAFEISDRGDKLLSKTKTFSAELEKRGEIITRAGVDYFFNTVVIVGVLGIIAMIALITGLSYLSRVFSRKISDISHGMARLAQGDDDFTIDGQDRADEIGEMSRALEMFKRSNRKLQQWASERAARADEEVEHQQSRASERAEAEERRKCMLDELAKQFEHTVGEVVHKVTGASSELQVTATRMASVAEQTSEHTGLVSKDMSEANAGAVSAAAASDEFALSIAEISRQATSSADLARLATDATVEADTTISKLADSAEQVGEIVELIQTIAQRTNLLALNASIEAARGGEAGRGFAVVASEVKELAMQTSRATEQIADQIRAMQDTTGASVSALRSIAGQVRELETTAISIASAVDEQSVAGQDLARSIDLAARGTEKVSSHIGELRELSLSTGAAASQVLTSANDLEMQAATLSDQVKGFLRRVREG